MALMRGKGPSDAVAAMDPKFIRQEGQSMASPIGAFSAGYCLPFFGLSHPGDSSGHQDYRHREHGPFRHTSSYLFHFSSSLLLLSLRSSGATTKARKQSVNCNGIQNLFSNRRNLERL
jgi:hypothetical protein